MRELNTMLQRGLVVCAAAGTMACGQTVPDLDNDGMISFDEVSIALAQAIQNEHAQDLNNDGIIDADEFIESVRHFYLAMQGDVNADGQVDGGDVQIVIDNLGSTSATTTTGDLTFDGEIDADDLIAALNALGSTVTQPESKDIKGLSVMALVGQQRMLPHIPAHHRYFSSTWPGSHEQGVSKTWPMEHGASISIRWDRPDPMRREQNLWASLLWPPNHQTEQSETWNVIDHSNIEARVRAWPASHWSGPSLDWPDRHLIVSSRVWPANHQAYMSMIGQPSPHNTTVSGHWDHDEAASLLVFPANHSTSASHTWADHNEVISLTWPAGHTQGPSGQWPASRPWPANHFEDTSESWQTHFVLRFKGLPTQSIPSFHETFQSIRLFSDLIDVSDFFSDFPAP